MCDSSSVERAYIDESSVAREVWYNYYYTGTANDTSEGSQSNFKLDPSSAFAGL